MAFKRSLFTIKNILEMSKKLLTVLPLGLIIVFVINNQFIKAQEQKHKVRQHIKTDKGIDGKRADRDK